MRSSARTALTSVLMVLCFTASIFAQGPVKQSAGKTPGGTVSGRITIKDKPAPGVLVVLRKEGTSMFEPVGRGVTEQDGVYRITNLAPGSYNVTPSTPAYVAADAAGRKSVVIGEDENVEGINFSLVRGGVVTGKVTDAEGRPVIQQQVEFYRAEALDQRRQQQMQQQPQQPKQAPPLYPARSVQTDDRGIYRAFGLLPGRYKVSAGRAEHSMAAFSLSPITYTQVFHPDAKDSAKATVIEVGEGTEATNVDIALGPTMQMFTASGRIIHGETGAPVPQVRFGLHRLAEGRVDYLNQSAMSNVRGDFTIEGLTPGKYGVFLFTEPGAVNELRAEKTTFEVVDQDVTGVTIKMTRGAVITGVIVLESEDKAVQRKLLDMKLHGYVETYPGASTAASSTIGPDGSFRLAGLPGGTANFNLFPSGLFAPTGFMIARIERDGISMPRLELKDGETVTGIKMFVRFGSATIRGVVSWQNGTMPPGMRVMIRLSKPGDAVPYNRQAEVDARGQFFMENLPSGMYELRAMVSGRGVARTLEDKKEVSLNDGTVTNVTFTIDVSTLGNQ